MDGIRRRSDAAFAAVHRALASDLASFANGMLHDRHAAEDCVQQAFLDLARTAHRFRGDGRALIAWLYRTVRRRALDELRRRRRHPERSLGTTDPAGDDEYDSSVVEALGFLPPKDRELVVLRHVVGLRADEVASITGRSRGAVYAATERAEARLRGILEEMDT
ncbi:MAG: sigma-70 family RNA polymerase sigma factor [Acidimicrobiia bacterium]|nr:sigma-70 family RNA polymerase sigma factor [Acidimicrobiia bacterium]